jgi:Ca2+-dependent lipid-binding protein
MSSMILPANIKLKKKQIEIILIKGESIVQMDVALIGKGTADPYIDFLYGGLKVTSKICKGTLNPVWNQKILVL